MSTAVRSVIIGSTVGLHARPASLFVQAATATGHRVTVTNSSGAVADASSILSVLALGVHHGDAVTLEVVGDVADAVADNLAQLLESNLDAEQATP